MPFANLIYIFSYNILGLIPIHTSISVFSWLIMSVFLVTLYLTVISYNLCSNYVLIQLITYILKFHWMSLITHNHCIYNFNLILKNKFICQVNVLINRHKQLDINHTPPLNAILYPCMTYNITLFFVFSLLGTNCHFWE